MVVMTFHNDHRIRGQLTGLTKSIRDESSGTDEATPKTSPKNIHITNENSGNKVVHCVCSNSGTSANLFLQELELVSEMIQWEQEISLYIF